MVGNHRDAWVFGGVDAGSGGSTMLEIARAVGEKMKQGTTLVLFITLHFDQGVSLGLYMFNMLA